MLYYDILYHIVLYRMVLMILMHIIQKHSCIMYGKNNIVSQVLERPSSQRMMRKTPDAVSFKLLRDANIY